MLEHEGRGLPRVPSVFCPTPAVLEVARHLPPLVVLRGPRGFGKTSSVAHWLRSGAVDGRSVAWFTVADPMTGPELWRGLHEALVLAGLAAAVPAPDRTSVGAALHRLSRRLVLVLDGLHNVADLTVDGELVELTQTHELLHLVVTSRRERPIASIGPATVDAAVIGVPQLLLTPAEAGPLASRLGVDVSEEEIAELVADYAGWPALVRAALLNMRRGPDGSLVTDPAATVRYVGLILHDLDQWPYREAVTALAVPDPVRTGDLTVLLDTAEQRSAAAVVLASSFMITRSGGAIRYPAGLRHALLETFRGEDAGRYRELNARLSQRRRQQQHAVEALRYARRAEAWPLVLAILEENWAQLLRRHTADVDAAVRAMPEELIASSPRLIVARDYVLDTDTAAQAETALRAGLLTPGGMLPAHSLTTTQRLALRFDGSPTYGAAETLLGHLDSERAARRTGQRTPEIQRAVPELLTQWALSQLYDNDGVGAAYAFTLAGQEAVRTADDRAAREAASGTALAMALLGHTGQAAAWTEHAARITAPVSGLEVIAGPLTAAILAGLRLAPAGFPAPPATAGQGLVPLLELSRVAAAFVDVLAGRLDRVRVELQRHAASGVQEEVVRASVAALQVDLALAEGRIDRAGTLLADLTDDSAWSLATRARHAFYVGAYREALRLTADAPSYAGTRPRVGLELLLIHACAALRAGERERAVDHLATAVGIADDTDVLSPFLTVPRADLATIATAGSWMWEFLEQPPLAGRDTVFPEPLQSGQLSAAELRVLRELAAGLPLAHIGRRLFISESTVKTHVRRIYRKLGVANRADALGRAQELFLLP